MVLVWAGWRFSRLFFRPMAVLHKHRDLLWKIEGLRQCFIFIFFLLNVAFSHVLML